jgi:hypothetical protein
MPGMGLLSRLRSSAAVDSLLASQTSVKRWSNILLREQKVHHACQGLMPGSGLLSRLRNAAAYLLPAATTPIQLHL